LPKTLCRHDSDEYEEEADEREGMRKISAGGQNASKPSNLKKNEVDQK
jgi:hypothetical protein